MSRKRVIQSYSHDSKWRKFEGCRFTVFFYDCLLSGYFHHKKKRKKKNTTPRCMKWMPVRHTISKYCSAEEFWNSWRDNISRKELRQGRQQAIKPCFPFWKGHYSELFLLYERKKQSKGRFLDSNTAILLPSLALPVSGSSGGVGGADPQV